MKEVMKLNHNVDPNTLKSGDTISLPMGKLSERDRQILDGMRAGNYRTYPVRKGESLDDVLSKRKISMEEFKQLNPDVNPKKVKGAPLPLTRGCCARAGTHVAASPSCRAAVLRALCESGPLPCSSVPPPFSAGRGGQDAAVCYNEEI